MMAGTSSLTPSGNSASSSRLNLVPHTRIEEESQLDKLYTMGRVLGQGSFGVVCEARHIETNELWACKIVNKEKAGSSAITLLEREVAILKQVCHEHIIRLNEVFETSRKMFLIMELCEGGELADVLKERVSFSERDTRIIVSRLSSAISYLHKKGMVHRDIKLENILLRSNPVDQADKLCIKVTDFGLSVVKGGVSHDNMMMDFCGTPMYMAPEIIENKTYSEKCDVWAMGVIVYMLLCGQPPFVGSDEEGLYEIIKTADIAEQFKTNSLWDDVSAIAKDCICGMLTIDPAHRLTAHEVTDHPWVTGEGQRPPNVLQMMKNWNMLEEDNTSLDENIVISDDPTKKKEPIPIIVQQSSEPCSSSVSATDTKENGKNVPGQSESSMSTSQMGRQRRAGSKEASKAQLANKTLSSQDQVDSRRPSKNTIGARQTVNRRSSPVTTTTTIKKTQQARKT